MTRKTTSATPQPTPAAAEATTTTATTTATATTTSPLRLCTLVSDDGESETLRPFVRCPQRGKTIDALKCMGCSRMRSLEWEPNVGGSVTCGGDSKDVTLQVVAAVHRLDRRADIGEAAARLPLHELVRPITTCVTPQLPISRAKELMKERGLRSIVVVDDSGKLQGLLSRTDIMRAPHFGAVGDVMMPSVHALPEDAPLGYAIALMAFEEVSEVPVVTEDGTLIGIYYALDALRWVASRMGYVCPHHQEEAERQTQQQSTTTSGASSHP